MAIDITKNPEIETFLNRNHLAVLATASKQSSTPHAAVVFYATDPQMNIYFVSKAETAKSQNLTSNPQAALVIYEAEAQRTAQISGLVNKVENQQMMDKALGIMAGFSKQTSGTAQLPISKLDAGQYILFQLTPQFIRVADYKYGAPNQIFDVATIAEESLDA